MATVTSGRVSYSRKVQPAQYESEGAEVELAFVLDEGEDPATAIDEIGAIAKEGALRFVGVTDRERRRGRFRGREE